MASLTKPPKGQQAVEGVFAVAHTVESRTAEPAAFAQAQHVRPREGPLRLRQPDLGTLAERLHRRRRRKQIARMPSRTGYPPSASRLAQSQSIAASMSPAACDGFHLRSTTTAAAVAGVIAGGTAASLANPPSSRRNPRMNADTSCPTASIESSLKSSSTPLPESTRRRWRRSCQGEWRTRPRSCGTSRPPRADAAAPVPPSLH